LHALGGCTRRRFGSSSSSSSSPSSSSPTPPSFLTCSSDIKVAPSGVFAIDKLDEIWFVKMGCGKELDDDSGFVWGGKLIVASVAQEVATELFDAELPISCVVGDGSIITEAETEDDDVVDEGIVGDGGTGVGRWGGVT
jgi:hypothetical protein